MDQDQEFELFEHNWLMWLEEIIRVSIQETLQIERIMDNMFNTNNVQQHLKILSVARCPHLIHPYVIHHWSKASSWMHFIALMEFVLLDLHFPSVSLTALPHIFTLVGLDESSSPPYMPSVFWPIKLNIEKELKKYFSHSCLL